MIRTEIVNPVTAAFVKEAHKIMRNKGYKLKTSKHSAQVEYSYTNPSNKDITLCGWHGDGRYGKLKLIMILYAEGNLTDIFVMPGNDPGKYCAGGPKSIFDGNNSDKITEEEFEVYKQNLEKAKKFLREF